MKTLHFVTSNRNKFIEAEKILGTGLKQTKLDITEIQSVKAREVVEFKAMEAYSVMGESVIAEDTALYIKEWKGFPGALVTWVVKTIGIERLCKLLGKERSATAESCIGYCDGKRVETFCGRVKGKIAKKPEGRKRFDWDRIFIPEGGKRTFAQMSLDEKNRISHRMKAFRKLKVFLKNC